MRASMGVFGMTDPMLDLASARPTMTRFAYRFHTLEAATEFCQRETGFIYLSAAETLLCPPS